MSLLMVSDPIDFNAIKLRTKIQVLDGVDEVQLMYIRNEYNSSKLDAKKLACIEVAVIMSFYDLADELAADLETEKLLATILTNLK